MNKSVAASPGSRTDWVIFSLRWLLLIGVLTAILLGRGSGTGPQIAITVVVAGVYNLLVASLLVARLSTSAFRAITVVGDSLLAVLYFWASAYSPVVMIGAGLLPIMVSGLRAGRRSALLSAALIGLLCFIVGLVGGISGIIGEWLAAALFLIVAAVLAGQARSDDGRPTQMSKQQMETSKRNRDRAIYELASTLGATLDYNKVLAAALDVGVLGLNDMGAGTRLFGMVMLFRNGGLRVAISRGLPRQDEKVTVPGREGILGQAIKQAETVIASEAKSDPELGNFVAFQDARSILAIPLRAGFDNYGLLVFGTTEKDVFSGDQVELLTAITTQATIALQNAVLYENLRGEKERIVEVEEDARKKLARDLHDGPTQSIAAIAMRVNYIRRLIEKQPQNAADELAKVEELARRTTKEIRHMLFTLRPLVLETQGLTAALQQFAEKMKDTHNLEVILQIKEGVSDLIETHAQGVLFYIIEEAVNNARKHAQAPHIYVRLYRHERYLVTEIQDDGVGFDLASVDSNYEQRGSLGMVNMRERAELIDGTLRIESAKGKGTKISIVMELKGEALAASQAPTQKSDAVTSSSNKPVVKRP